MGKFEKALFIFRRDYRLFDNVGWIAAAKASEKVIPGLNSPKILKFEFR
jgi:deoxyribodipyrimidine photolyase